jgi:hypothetical protein
MIPATRVYLDPGDRLSGRYDPPRLCRVVRQWGPGERAERGVPACTWHGSRPVAADGPRNVLARYEDGSEAVIPFSRRLRRTDRPPSATEEAA